MTDVRDDETIATDDDENRLPWLEPVDEDDEPEGPSTAKLIAFVVIGLVAIGLIVGGVFWLSNGNGDSSGQPELIAAPKGDYKVKPEEPGGMQVEGKGDTAFATSAGADPKAAIDVNAVAEAPVTRADTPKVAATASEPAQAAAGGTIQLGAFSSQASANSAWKALSGRFGYLAPLTHNVVPVESGGKTLYRLRASGPGVNDLCARLRVAGESCVSVN